MAKYKRRNKNARLFAVIGLGRFGFALAEELAAKGEEVMVIDRDREMIDKALSFTDNAFVVGELNADNLRETGIEEADVAIICIGEKLDVSILATMTVLKLGVTFPRQNLPNRAKFSPCWARKWSIPNTIWQSVWQENWSRPIFWNTSHWAAAWISWKSSSPAKWTDVPSSS